jgi:methionine synthase II (cobalamin-independent)
VPNYPQYRDMTSMFFEVIEGFERSGGGFVETAPLTLKERRGVIAEVLAIKNRSRYIYEKLGGSFQLRICVTGPYTMSSLLPYKDKNTFTRLGKVLTEIIEANIFNIREGKVQLVSIDEPAFGFIDEPLLDRGSEGRENLLRAWESMAQKIIDRGAEACLHLHNTSDELFWDVEKVRLIESHVNDPFYQAKRTKERLESSDKFVKASIATTDFDELIRSHIVQGSKKELSETSLNEEIASAWKRLNAKQVDPMIFVEDVELMKSRLSKIVTHLGENRVTYAGTECGLRSFPVYESAIECLKRVSQAVRGG